MHVKKKNDLGLSKFYCRRLATLQNFFLVYVNMYHTEDSRNVTSTLCDRYKS